MLLSSNSNVHSMSVMKSSIRPDALQVANIRRGMDVGMLLTGVPLVVITRALNIYPLAFLVNKGMLSLHNVTVGLCSHVCLVQKGLMQQICFGYSCSLCMYTTTAYVWQCKQRCECILTCLVSHLRT